MIGNKGSYALVTGASTGIGYDLAKLFAKDGKDVIVIARSEDKLEELKSHLEKEYGVKVRVLVSDLADPRSPQEIFRELEKDGVQVDVLVNNAGFAVYGMFSDTDWQQENDMIQVNAVAPTQLTKLFLKKMLEKKSGKILNISSGVGLLPAGWVAVYSATKHYLLGFSNALANELKGTGVSVTCFCPAMVNTPFYKRANAENCRAFKGGAMMMDSATTAKLAYRALEKGKTTAAAQSYLSFIGVRLMPRKMASAVMSSLLQPATR